MKKIQLRDLLLITATDEKSTIIVHDCGERYEVHGMFYEIPLCKVLERQVIFFSIPKRNTIEVYLKIEG